MSRSTIPHYGKTGGSYEYHFAPGDMYEIGKLKGIGI